MPHHLPYLPLNLSVLKNPRLVRSVKIWRIAQPMPTAATIFSMLGRDAFGPSTTCYNWEWDKMAADLGAEISWNLLSATALHEHWQLGTPHPCSPPSWIRLCPSAPPPRALGFFVISRLVPHWCQGNCYRRDKGQQWNYFVAIPLGEYVAASNGNPTTNGAL